MDYQFIDSVEVEGVDTMDYPDFSDAFISSAEYKGKLMTEIQLEELNNDGDFLYESIQNSLF